MKNFKRTLALGAALAMTTTALAGCGASDQGSTTAKATTAANSGSDNAAASSDAKFKLGGIGPVTGGAAIYGSAVKTAIQIAVDEINAAGGINGYQVEYQFQDDEHDAEKAVNAYNTLKDWGMQILVGTVTSAPCVAVVEETHNDNMFQLTPSGTAVDCIAYDNAFRVCFSDPNQGKASAQYIGSKNLATKVAIIYDSSDTYSTGIHDTFVAESANQSFEVVADQAFTSDSKTDFSVQIQAAKDAGADLLFLPIYYQEASLILAQAKTSGYEPSVIFGCDGLDGILSVENFDTSLAEGVYLLTPFSATATDDLTVKFVEAYKAAANGEVPNQFAADAYDAVYAIKQAAEAQNITPDMSTSDICEALKKGITSVTYAGLTGDAITWGADGEPNKAPKAVVIKSGVYELAE
jgi:branched-chain amino acid transport system substrate-binding protein